jgi:hypothetical protein
VGQAIAVSSAPQDVLNGTYLVRAVRHHYTKRDGFATLVVFSAAGGNGGGPGGLSGLAGAAAGLL